MFPGLRCPSHSFTREPASAGFLRCGCRKPVKGLHDLCQSVRPRGTGNVHATRGQAPHETEFRMRLARLALALLSMVPVHVFAVEIDGRIEPGEWQGAHHVTDFRKVQPLSGAPASLPTEERKSTRMNYSH